MRTLLMSAIVAATTVLAGFAASTANAQGGVCSRLWIERNSIYKAHGYCFKTQRAITHFGNAGCVYDYEGDVPLSGTERALIGRITAEERALGCR
jgi:hypothetical protein